MSDAVLREWKRLCERFEMRVEIFDRTRARHKVELDLVYDDLVEAGAARDCFAKEHPEVKG